MVLDWFTALFTRPVDDRLGSVQFPGPAFSSPVEAIYTLLNAGFRDDEWASFDARDGAGQWVTVQVSGPQVNTLVEPVDLSAALRAAGLEALANSVIVEDEATQRRSQAHDVQWGEHPVAGTLFTLPGTTPDELAEAVNAVFTQHYGFSPMYELSGTRES